MAAVEALVRWNHPTRGAVGPADFIAIAEENGVINELGAYVLRQACLDGLHWPGLLVSVNVSAVQLHNPAFANPSKRSLERQASPSIGSNWRSSRAH